MDLTRRSASVMAISIKLTVHIRISYKDVIKSRLNISKSRYKSMMERSCVAGDPHCLTMSTRDLSKENHVQRNWRNVARKATHIVFLRHLSVQWSTCHHLISKGQIKSWIISLLWIFSCRCTCRVIKIPKHPHHKLRIMIRIATRVVAACKKIRLITDTINYPVILRLTKLNFIRKMVFVSMISSIKIVIGLMNVKYARTRACFMFTPSTTTFGSQKTSVDGNNPFRLMKCTPLWMTWTW